MIEKRMLEKRGGERDFIYQEELLWTFPFIDD